MHNYHTLTTILLRVISIDQNQLINLLQPNNGRLPTDQIQYDLMVSRIRQMGHILEHAPGNLLSGLHRRQTTTAYTNATEQVFVGYAGDGQEPAGQPWSYTDNFNGVFAQAGGNSDVHGNANSEYVYTAEDGADSGTDTGTISSLETTTMTTTSYKGSRNHKKNRNFTGLTKSPKVNGASSPASQSARYAASSERL